MNLRSILFGAFYAMGMRMGDYHPMTVADWRSESFANYLQEANDLPDVPGIIYWMKNYGVEMTEKQAEAICELLQYWKRNRRF